MAIRKICPHHGFTIIEILVASAVLVVMLIMVVQLVNSTTSLTTHAQKNISVEEEARQVLDRISTDLERLIHRSDLGQRVEKNSNGDDAISFYSQVRGYEGNRSLSRIGYRMVNGQLIREATGTFWLEEEGAQATFSTTNLPALANAESEVIGPHVFRHELAFLMADGSIRQSVSGFHSDIPAEKVRALIVGIAVLDDQSRQAMQGDLSVLAAKLGDAQDSAAGESPSRDIRHLWSPVINNPDTYSDTQVPLAAVRIYQRYFFLD